MKLKTRYKFLLITGTQVLLLILLCPDPCLYAQSSEEIQCLKLEPDKHPEHSDITVQGKQSGKSKLKGAWLFRFYKQYISSQDYGSCGFTPSCSEYAIIAVNQQGIIIGSLNTFDRLLRCHGGNDQHYEADTKEGLLIDEARDHKYEQF
jgi:putative component of membrane protein insertase Oxa1/YidC/SpoIIIJ protein YidD